MNSTLMLTSQLFQLNVEMLANRMHEEKKLLDSKKSDDRSITRLHTHTQRIKKKMKNESKQNKKNFDTLSH